ncbi:MAG: shikimate kinase [Pirellulales bacterium]
MSASAPLPERLVLIGYRGAGKTSVARQLALALGWDWVDADVEIELKAGRSIAAIFAEQGEPAFRDLESQTLAKLLGRTKLIVAAGGGAVVRCENRKLLRRGGPVVWLQASPETIWRRIQADASTAARRPNLTGFGGLAEVQTLLAQRTPWYAECASLTVDTEGKSVEQICQEILAGLSAVPGAGGA